MQWKKVIQYIHNPYKIVNFLGVRGRLNFLSDELYLKLIYQACVGRKLNLNNPTTFNEKLQWLKLHDRNPIYTQMVDKYDVRQYIARTIGEEYLIPLLGVWDKFEDIHFPSLPHEFVLKCTHDSGSVVICKDNNEFDLVAAREKINQSLKRNYYDIYREWPYKNVKPKIICEKYMVDESGVDLKDYKIMCFNGKAKCSFVCLNRNLAKGLNENFYDMNWDPLPTLKRHYSNSGTSIAKPRNFNKMVELAEKLSENIPFLRVDFYEINGKLFIGELTFFDDSGFEEFTQDSYDYLLGSWIDLPLKRDLEGS